MTQFIPFQQIDNHYLTSTLEQQLEQTQRLISQLESKTYLNINLRISIHLQMV